MFIENLQKQDKEILEFLLKHKDKSSKSKAIFTILYPVVKILKEDYSVSLKSIRDLIQSELNYNFGYSHFTNLYNKRKRKDDN